MTTTPETTPFRSKYGATETNGLIDANAASAEIDRSYTSFLTDPKLTKIYRLRLISDPGFPLWDLSYCWGILDDGRKVCVQLPVHQFPKKRLLNAIVEMCKREGVYAKGLGLLDPETISRAQ